MALGVLAGVVFALVVGGGSGGVLGGALARSGSGSAYDPGSGVARVERAVTGSTTGSTGRTTGRGRVLTVLHAWDRRRAAAYAADDVPALRALYAPASLAGRADVRLLLDYRRRGLRVASLRSQLLSVRVLRESPRRWRAVVVDRVEASVVAGAQPVALPRDRATRRVVTMRREPGGWVVVSVR